MWCEAVDLIPEQGDTSDGKHGPRIEDKVLIRPDPDRMPLAFAADKLLRELGFILLCPFNRSASWRCGMDKCVTPLRSAASASG